ncbi:MAG: NADH:ubiquinone oxidoreductase [Elusimicrobiota bacterium]
MSLTLYWMQTGCCSGDSMSLLNTESPNLVEALSLLDVDVLWHPSLSNPTLNDRHELHEHLLLGRKPLDILCVEGAVLRGPGGTGMYDTVDGKPKKNLVSALAKRAQYVVAVGTCASFGGIVADGEVEATGLQFHKTEKGGFLGKDFTAGSGLPVINLAGCPVHCEAVVGALSALAAGTPLDLDDYHRPVQWYGMVVHQGCTRNEYHEYRVEEKDFGEKGCLFFHMGCQGPLTYGPCNKLLWNRRSSKTRVGVPCHGCTQPDFPKRHPFFETRNIEGIPIDLPDGVKRAHYMVYKGMAAVASPERLKKRKTGI